MQDANIADILRADNWAALSRQPLALDGPIVHDWSTERIFVAALALSSRAILVGILVTLTIAGKPETVIQMQAEARDRRPELGAEIIREVQIQVNNIIHNRQAATAKLRSVIAQEFPDYQEVEDAIIGADREGLAVDPVTSGEYEAAVALLAALNSASVGSNKTSEEQVEIVECNMSSQSGLLDIIENTCAENNHMPHPFEGRKEIVAVKNKGRAKSKGKAKRRAHP